LLLVGQTPPPLHGQSVVTQLLFDYRWRQLEVQTLRMAFSETISEIGGLSWRKIVHLIQLCFSALVSIGIRRSYVYYPAASPKLIPFIRDAIFLSIVRPFSKGIILHYHAGGLVPFLRTKPYLDVVARMIYGRAVLSIEIMREDESPGRHFRAHRVRNIPNGIDVPDSARCPSGSKVPVILYVGSVRRSKGIYDLVETARILHERNFSCRFVVVGAWVSDEQRKDVVSRISAGGLSDMIEFTGGLSGAPKWERFRHADVFFFPSFYESENFPMALLEAMGAGLPIVATEWRGVPELTGKSGPAILCPPKSPQAYADALGTLLRDPALRERMGRLGKERHSRLFSEKRFQESVEWEIAHAISAVELRRRNRLRNFLRPLGQWIIRLFGTEITDQRTGKSLGKALLFPWRGRVVCIGLKNGVRAEFLPQNRLTYWRQELGFATPSEPDFSNEKASDRSADPSGA